MNVITIITTLIDSDFVKYNVSIKNRPEGLSICHLVCFALEILLLPYLWCDRRRFRNTGWPGNKKE